MHEFTKPEELVDWADKADIAYFNVPMSPDILAEFLEWRWVCEHGCCHVTVDSIIVPFEAKPGLLGNEATAWLVATRHY